MATHVTLVDVNNVRGRMRFPVLGDFCDACWRWAQAKDDGQLLFLALDYGSSVATVRISKTLAVGFAGPRNDADTIIAREVDRILSSNPLAVVTVVTEDVQLLARCRRQLPNLTESDPWFAAHGLLEPGTRKQTEWRRGATRPASHLERLWFMRSDLFAAELELDESPWRQHAKQLAAPQPLTGLLWVWTWCCWLFGIMLSPLLGASAKWRQQQAHWRDSDPPFATGPPLDGMPARGTRRGRRSKRATRHFSTMELYGPERSEDRQIAAALMQQQLTARYGTQ